MPSGPKKPLLKQLIFGVDTQGTAFPVPLCQSGSAVVVCGSVTVSVNMGGSIASSFIQFAENSATAASVVTTLLTHLASGTTFIDGFSGSGGGQGQFQLVINNSVSMKLWNDRGNLNVGFAFPTPFKAISGTTIDVKVQHFASGTLCEFNASIMGHFED